MVALSFSSKKNVFVGIDVTSTHVAVVELSWDKKQERTKLETYGILALESQKESSESIEESIGRLLKATKAQSEDVVIGMPTAEAHIAVLKLPYTIHQEDLDTAVKQKAKEIFGGEIKSMAIGWSIIKHHVEKNDELQINADKSVWKILFVAVPQAEIRETQQRGRKIERTLIAPEVKALALVRALEPQLQPTHTIVHREGGTYETIRIQEGNITEVETGLAYEDIFEIVETMPIEERNIVISGEKAVSLEEGLRAGPVQFKALEKANPWRGILIPQGLQDALKVIGPEVAVAVGLAMREISKEHNGR